MDLFSARDEHPPLSKRVMPKTLETYVGQQHLVGAGKPLRAMLESGILHSMIFAGPPATGKTTLAEILSGALKYNFIKESALMLNSDSIKEILRVPGKTVLFVDEIHRLNRPKQDLFLGPLERGDIILIGATTENPFFILQPALRSRVFIFEFKRHSEEDLSRILREALARDPSFSDTSVSFEGNAEQILVRTGQDARRILNAVEMILLTKNKGKAVADSDPVVIEEADVHRFFTLAETRYSSFEGHYDVISAFIKSVRGSDPDAAIYYLALMLESGEDPLFIARRLVILAAEDIGLAYPEALTVAVSCYQATENIGMPEARIPLAETTVLLAGAPKSNAAYMAIDAALRAVREGTVLNVPRHLKNYAIEGTFSDKRDAEYRYPHDYENHWTDQQYLDKPVRFYTGGTLGFEKNIVNWLSKIKGEKKQSAE